MGPYFDDEKKKPITRQLLTELAQLVHPEMALKRTLALAPDEISQRGFMVLHNWGRAGFQSVELPETYAAALMATDPGDALQTEELPWPAFEIQVPPGLVESSHGEIFSLMISSIPKIVKMAGEAATAKVIAVYHDLNSTGADIWPSLHDMAKGTTLGDLEFVTDELAALYDASKEKRVWSMLTRLAAGVILNINQARADKPAAYPQREARTKHGKPKINTHRLGQALKIDCRQSIRDFIAGASQSSPAVTTLVRGHYKRQAHGPKWSLHRRVWLHPYYRGDGPLLYRPTKITAPDEL